MSRRGNGVRKDPRTGNFVARIVDAHGRRVCAVRKRERDALSWLAEQRRAKDAALRAAERGERAPASPNKRELVLVRDYADRWLAHKRPDIAQSTYSRYKAHVEWVKNGPLGRLAADEISFREIEDWLSEIAEQTRKTKAGEIIPRYAFTTVNGMMQQVLKPMTKRLQIEHALPIWPCDGVKIPKRIRRRKGTKRKALTRPELGRFLAALDDKWFAGKNWKGIFWVCATTGMRPCEVLALHRRHLDFSNGRIIVELSAYQGVVKGETKTGDPREPALLPEVATVLAQYLKDAPTKDGLLFQSSSGGPHWESAIDKPFYKALEIAKIDRRPGIVPYSLRTTFNTIAKSLGQDDLTLRNVMGHTDAAMTERYLDTSLEQRTALQQSVFNAATVECH